MSLSHSLKLSLRLKPKFSHNLKRSLNPKPGLFNLNRRWLSLNLSLGRRGSSSLFRSHSLSSISLSRSFGLIRMPECRRICLCRDSLRRKVCPGMHGR